MRAFASILFLIACAGSTAADAATDYRRYPALVMVAIAKVVEARCGGKGQVDAAFAKAKRNGIAIDPSNKDDAAGIEEQVGYQMQKSTDLGVESWCRTTLPTFNAFLAKP